MIKQEIREGPTRQRAPLWHDVEREDANIFKILGLLFFVIMAIIGGVVTVGEIIRRIF